jgi:hypothetical protein
MSKALTELIRDANREITPADRHMILDLVEEQAAEIAKLSIELEHKRSERNAVHVHVRREIGKEYQDRIAELEAQIASLAKSASGG